MNSEKVAVHGTLSSSSATETGEPDSLALDVEDVYVQYGNVKVLNGVSLQLRRGQVLVLLGPSGCGKTTLLRCICGFSPLERGRIVSFGMDMAGVKASERDYGLVFQNFALFPHLSVKENVAFPLRVRHVPRERLEAEPLEMLKRVGLEEFADRKPRELSGGQQQRVGLARALISKPRLLLLDEPVSNLDAKLRDGLRREISLLVREFNTSTVYVTHDQKEAFSIGDVIAVMDRGKMVQIGTPKEIVKHPRNKFVAETLGCFEMIPVERRGGKIYIEKTDTLVEGSWLSGDQLTNPIRTLAIDRSRIVIRKNGENNDVGGIDNWVPATAKTVSYLGERLEITLNIIGNNAEIISYVGTDELIKSGEMVMLGFPGSGATALSE